MEVHRILGPSFLEPVYQAALQVEFETVGVPYSREVELPVYSRGTPLSVRYRADFLCNGDVLVELLNFGSHSFEFKRFVGLNSPLRLSSMKSVQSVGRQL